MYFFQMVIIYQLFICMEFLFIYIKNNQIKIHLLVDFYFQLVSHYIRFKVFEKFQNILLVGVLSLVYAFSRRQLLTIFKLIFPNFYGLDFYFVVADLKGDSLFSYTNSFYLYFQFLKKLNDVKKELFNNSLGGGFVKNSEIFVDKNS